MTSSRVISWIGILSGIAVAGGALCALVWSRVVQLPSYVVQADYSAVITERGHSEVIGADAWFTLIGVVAGLALGGLAWSWFRSLGWPVALIAAGAGLAAGLVCWAVGPLFGPGPFETRLASAKPGDVVPISLQLHAPSALALWSLASVVPALVASALGPELVIKRDSTGRRWRSTSASAEVEPHSLEPVEQA